MSMKIEEREKECQDYNTFFQVSWTFEIKYNSMVWCTSNLNYRYRELVYYII